MLKLNLRGHEIYLTNDIKEYATKKMNALCKKYKAIISIDMALEENHNKKEATAAVASATVMIPGKDISGKASERTIFAAIDVLQEKLQRQLEKDKNMHHSNSKGKFSKSKDIIRKLFKQA